MPRTPLQGFLVLSFLGLLALPGKGGAADADEASPDSAGPRREWTLSGGLASGYGYGAEPKPVPADLRHLKPTSTVSFGVARQRASGRGIALRVDGMQYNDRHATRDLFGTPISVRRSATVIGRPMTR